MNIKMYTGLMVIAAGLILLGSHLAHSAIVPVKRPAADCVAVDHKWEDCTIITVQFDNHSGAVK